MDSRERSGLAQRRGYRAPNGAREPCGKRQSLLLSNLDDEDSTDCRLCFGGIGAFPFSSLLGLAFTVLSPCFARKSLTQCPLSGNCILARSNCSASYVIHQDLSLGKRFASRRSWYHVYLYTPIFLDESPLRQPSFEQPIPVYSKMKTEYLKREGVTDDW